MVSLKIRDTDPLVLGAWFIDLVKDSPPDLALTRVIRSTYFAPDTKDGAHCIATIARFLSADQDNCGDARSGNVGARGVEDVGEFNLMREEIFDELLAEFTLHKGVGGDLADVASAATISIGWPG